MTLTYASLCDGIGAAHAAWQPLGWRCAWTSEIADFPAAVVAARWGFPNLGDMTRITDEQIEQHPRPDLVVGGTPCQSFSVAGLRAGLADPRGNLALVYLGMVDRLRPRWVVWENVPGVLSSAGGRDFGIFLGALGELGYGFAYRVLDAQYFGVPQRRRRVFVVGHLGEWAPAAAVLLERESLSGHPPPRRAAGEGVAASLTRGADSKGRGGYAGRRREDDENLTVAHALTGNGFDASEDGTGRGTPLVLAHGQANAEVLEDQCPTLNCNHEQPIMAFQTRCSRNGRGMPAPTTTALTSCECGSHADTKPHVFGGNLAPRKLTPRECERLQGFPDDYTLIPGASNSRRYQALGNSMAVPVMRWIGERIAAVENLTQHPKLSLTP